VLAPEWAIRYAAAGWRVYPVEPGRKKPFFTGWETGATSDAELIVRQWRREPYPNVGLICGETFAVFDIEAPHLPAFFHYLEAGARLLPETPVSSTGGGGIHIYVKPLPGAGTTRQLRLAGVHIGEFKTTGGVVAPPSTTVGQYRWLWLPDDRVVAEAPDWLATLIAEPRPSVPSDLPHATATDPAAALDALARAVRDEPAGNRNAMLFWAACRALEDGIRLDIAEAVLRRSALAAGLPEPEALATIESAFKRQRVMA
jgi:hypothetical protein